MTPLGKYKVASVQASPVFFDAAATVAKTVELIKEAAANGASLVVFPELWIPGLVKEGERKEAELVDFFFEADNLRPLLRILL